MAIELRLPEPALTEETLIARQSQSFALVSPTDDSAATERKLTEYLSNGVRGGVMLDPASKTVTIARSGAK